MQMMRFFLWAGLAILPLSLSAQTAAAPPANRYVGSEACKTCHSDLWFTFYKNPHFKSIAAGNLDASKTGCEGCHGPGGNHVDAHGGKETIPRAFSLMTAAQALDTCLECHAKDLPRANIRRSDHTLADVACNSCHSIHHSPAPKFLLAKPQAQLCYGCHAQVRAQFDMPVKHRVNEGVVQCTDCHNPHGAFAPTWRNGLSGALVTTALDNEQPCLKCHVDKRGPFVFEHASVRVEGCVSCHMPHGSTNSKLLRRPVVFTLCLECHNGAGTFGRQNTGIVTQSSTHNMQDPRYQRCTLCHVRIHGSNADARFLR